VTYDMVSPRALRKCPLQRVFVMMVSFQETPRNVRETIDGPVFRHLVVMPRLC
jgi:hypothetical protein